MLKAVSDIVFVFRYLFHCSFDVLVFKTSSWVTFSVISAIKASSVCTDSGTHDTIHISLALMTQFIEESINHYTLSWYSGSLHRQIIRNHDINYARQTDPCFPREWISTTCVILVLWNDRKCKYIFMFPKTIFGMTGLNNETLPHLSIISISICLETYWCSSKKPRTQLQESMSLSMTVLMASMVSLSESTFLLKNRDCNKM